MSVHGLGVRTFANALFHKRGRALPVRGPTQQVSPARAVCRRHARKQRTELVEAQHEAEASRVVIAPPIK